MGPRRRMIISLTLLRATLAATRLLVVTFIVMAFAAGLGIHGMLLILLLLMFAGFGTTAGGTLS